MVLKYDTARQINFLGNLNCLLTVAKLERLKILNLYLAAILSNFLAGNFTKYKPKKLHGDPIKLLKNQKGIKICFSKNSNDESYLALLFYIYGCLYYNFVQNAERQCRTSKQFAVLIYKITKHVI